MSYSRYITVIMQRAAPRSPHGKQQRMLEGFETDIVIECIHHLLCEPGDLSNLQFR